MQASRRFVTRLALIGGAALVVRLGAVVTDWRRTQPPGITDEGGYHFGANLLAQGRGLINPFSFLFFDKVEPTAGHPPLYTMVLSVPSVLGFDTPLSHRIFTLFIGVAVVVAVGFLARELAGDRAGLVAAGLAAIYPALWISDTAIMPEALYSLLIVLGFWFGYRLWREPSVRLALGLGVLVSLAALTRSEGLLLFPLVALPFVVLARGADRAKKLRLAGIVAAVGIVLIGAWVGRNLLTFEKPTFMASGSGHVLAAANCDDAYHGDYLGYWGLECGLKVWPKGDESVVDVAARELGTRYIEEHLDRVPIVVAARVGRVWELYRPLENVNFNATLERRGLWPSRLALVMYYVLAALAIYGLVVMRRRKLPISPIVGLVIALTVTSAVSIGITRYRAPADALLPVLAAIALEGWLARRMAPTEFSTEEISEARSDLVGAQS